MHRSRYYRNPAMYASGAEFHPRFPLSHTRNTYKTTSTTPFSPSQMKLVIVIILRHITKFLFSFLLVISREPKTSQHFSNPRFVDRSKYVWTANKQTSQSTHPSVQQTLTRTVRPAPKPKKNPNSRELSVLSVTGLDPAAAVAKDIALNLREEKVYLIRKYDSILIKYAPCTSYLGLIFCTIHCSSGSMCL